MVHFLEIKKDFWDTNFDIYNEHLLESLRESVEEDSDEESLQWASEYDYDYTWGMYYMNKFGGDENRSGSHLQAGKIFFNFCGKPSIEIDEFIIGDSSSGEQILLENGYMGTNFRFSDVSTVYRIVEYLAKDLCQDLPIYFDSKKKFSKKGWVLLELDL